MAGTDRSQAIAFDPSSGGDPVRAAAGREHRHHGARHGQFRAVGPASGRAARRLAQREGPRRGVARRPRHRARSGVRARLSEAIADLSLVYATTARRRELAHEVVGPDEAARRLSRHIGAGGKAGIAFGREKWGLYNEEVALCDTIVTLPVEPAFASLNIAQAVLVLAYEWRRVATSAALPFAAP